MEGNVEKHNYVRGKAGEASIGQEHKRSTCKKIYEIISFNVLYNPLGECQSAGVALFCGRFVVVIPILSA